MLSKISIFKYFILTLFLEAYVSVFVVEQACGNDHLKETANLQGKPHSHENGHDHHSHSHEKEGPKHSHADNHVHHEHKGKKEGDCCNDKTADFFNSLTHPVTHNYDLKDFQLLVCDLQVESYFVEIFSKQINNPFINYWPPPPKIPDIRVFLHSFTV